MEYDRSSSHIVAVCSTTRSSSDPDAGKDTAWYRCPRCSMDKSTGAEWGRIKRIRQNSPAAANCLFLVLIKFNGQSIAAPPVNRLILPGKVSRSVLFDKNRPRRLVDIRCRARNGNPFMLFEVAADITAARACRANMIFKLLPAAGITLPYDAEGIGAGRRNTLQSGGVPRRSQPLRMLAFVSNAISFKESANNAVATSKKSADNRPLTADNIALSQNLLSSGTL